KSNILEAIGLFSLPYFKYNKSKKLTQFVRVENLAELFFDGDIGQKITICADDDSFCTADYLAQLGLVKFEIDLKGQNSAIESILGPLDIVASNEYKISVDNRLNLAFIDRHQRQIYPWPPKVNLYKFPQTVAFKKPSIFLHNLLPPNGANLLEVIEHDKLLENELSTLFTEYGLKLLFDKVNQTLRIDKPLKENAASFPFSSIADTLQRLVFFKAAIASNKNSILLFEEPEAHCFPPYIRQITQDILDSETNQFFIATHSPYVLNDFLEYERNDVAIFIANFKNGETVIRRLTDEEINDVYQYGIDLFFNHELFTDDQEH
ncbi:MAG: AAA family ATPase, partial [Methylococcales bacterium]|nr:AAA family ATPase [Methylococcales bacterium]